MAKDKEVEKRYKAEGIRRASIRKDKRRKLRGEKQFRYGKKICPYCGGYQTWCRCCEVWSSTCCQEYGTCECS